jgi:ATP-binding cassette, subfamily F, member 3
MLFRLEDVHKSYGAHDVLRGMTFQVNPGERVGLVGRNGAGKTTVFRLVTRIEEADKGTVSLLRGLRVGMLDQRPVFAGHHSVLDETLTVFKEFHRLENEMSRLEHLMAETEGAALDEAMHAYSDLRHRYEMEGGFTYPSRAEAVLVGLGFQESEFTQTAELLSGGQKARLALAKLLLSEPDVLLLDEPTNHLDVRAVEWLEDFFSDYKSAFVIISHDRFLLDRLATKIVEVDQGQANVYQGNYSAYVKQREERLLVQMREYDKQQEMIARTEDFIRRNLAGQKTKQAKSRRNMLERLERVESVRQDQTGNFKLQSVTRTGDHVLAVSDLAVGYGEKRLATGISFLLTRGERLGVIGANGSGKTTFLKTLTGEIEPLDGGLTWGANVQADYFDQELSRLDNRASVIEEMGVAAPRATEGELRGYLARFLFTGDEIYKSVGALSGGERSRLALAKLIYSKANVLILDEPTNHLDIPSREALENALAEYQGTIITVSHDRYFLDRIATEILHFESGATEYHMGSYSDYYDLRHRNKTIAAEEQRDRQRAQNKQQKPSAQKAKKRRGRSTEEIESAIGTLEKELAELQQSLANPASHWGADKYLELGNREKEIAAQLESLMQEWEEASHTA